MDLLVEIIRQDEEFRLEWEAAHIAQINEQWPHLDALNRTTFKWMYGDKVGNQ